MGINIYNYEERKKIKKNNKKFFLTRNLWNYSRCNRREVVGSIMNIIKKYSDGKTYEQDKEILTNEGIEKFIKYYFKNFVSEEDFKKNAIKFQTYCKKYGLELTDEEALVFCYIRVFDESAEGHLREIEAMKTLKKMYRKENGYNCRYAVEDEDCNMAIDIIINRNGEVIAGFQVKPISFYKGILGKASGCMDALMQNTIKQKKFIEKYKTDVFYFIEDNLYFIDENRLILF